MAVPLAYLSGRYLPVDEVRLSFNDGGFVWGATVTDLCRTFRQRLYRLDDHVRRFRQSCELAHVPLLADDAELGDIAGRLVAENAPLVGADGELILVLFATPGPIGFHAGRSENGPPTLGLYTYPLPFARYRRLFEEGARLVVPRTRQVPAACVDPRIKQRSRMTWWIAEQQAHDVDPMTSALLLDVDGFVTETATANLLIVKDGRVQTPWRGRVLNGVSLAVVQELCGKLGIPFDEVDLSLADCTLADEAMLANTSFCLAPVRQIQDATLACPGMIFERLLAAWSDQVSVDIRLQFVEHPFEGWGE